MQKLTCLATFTESESGTDFGGDIVNEVQNEFQVFTGHNLLTGLASVIIKKEIEAHHFLIGILSAGRE